MNAIALEVPISALLPFSGDARLFRAFGHLLAARHGELLAVPLGRTTGDLRGVVDGCPVPWGEVFAALDHPGVDPHPVPADQLCVDHPRLALLTPYGWSLDRFQLPGSQTEISRLQHPAGIRFSWVKS